MPSTAYHPLVRAVARDLRAKCGVAEGDAPLLAVSGGADSLALLRACALLAPRRGWKLRLGVAHVHHGVRKEAEAEAQAVAALAAELGLPFFREDLDPASFKGRNLEEAMREARYGALAKVARAHGFSAVATAHHADDQLETLLLRLCRGCRPEALAGIRWQRELAPGLRLIRPLLGVEHADALDFLGALGQAWHEDASNTDEARARALLRGRVVPALKELHPAAAKKAVELGEAVAEEWRGSAGGSALAGQVARTTSFPLGDFGDGRRPVDLPDVQVAAGRLKPTLRRSRARALPPADLRRELKAFLRAQGVARVNAALLAQIAGLCADHHGKTRTVDLVGKRKLLIEKNEIRVAP